MQTKVVTTITSTIDLDTMTPSHSAEIASTDPLPENVVKAIVVGACKSVLSSLEGE